ncbi:hypothetical protein ACJ41O_009471 [Fusarium nematophilum]
MLSTTSIPFLIHALVETPAALSFILKPSSQLDPLSPQAALILQSLGGLLLALNLIALIFARRPFDQDTQHVALAFAFWHIWPCRRAVVRLRGSASEGGEPPSTRGAFGGPVVHLGVHLMLLTMFLGVWYFGSIQESII